jgi:hypothetical protein
LQLLYQDWLQLPPQLMTVKEAVLLLQRLAYVQDRFDADPATCAKWHCLFLDIVYNICTSSTLPPVSQSNLVKVGQHLVKAGQTCTSEAVSPRGVESYAGRTAALPSFFGL